MDNRYSDIPLPEGPSRETRAGNWLYHHSWCMMPGKGIYSSNLPPLRPPVTQAAQPARLLHLPPGPAEAVGVQELQEELGEGAEAQEVPRALCHSH